MAQIRVLVVDDSAFARVALTRLLSSDPEIEVVGEAKDGLEALAKVNELKPDVITLDVTMPNLDGLQTLERLMRERPTPTVMVSALTRAGADVTLEALAKGAVDFIPKVARSRGGALVQTMDGELVTKVKAAAGARIAAPAPKVPSGVSSPAGDWLDRVVVIASSTGGPQALSTLIPALPGDFGAPVVIVQHLPAAMTPAFSKRLDSMSKLTVQEARRGSQLRKGLVLVAPGGFHVQVTRNGLVRLTESDPECGVRPAGNVTMESVARSFGSNTIGVVLTGMGNDGTRGAGLIKKAGGVVLAEASETCVIYGMPRSAIEAGYVDRIVPLHEIANEIVRACSRSYAETGTTS